MTNQKLSRAAVAAAVAMLCLSCTDRSPPASSTKRQSPAVSKAQQESLPIEQAQPKQTADPLEPAPSIEKPKEQDVEEPRAAPKAPVKPAAPKAPAIPATSAPPTRDERVTLALKSLLREFVSRSEAQGVTVPPAEIQRLSQAFRPEAERIADMTILMLKVQKAEGFSDAVVKMASTKLIPLARGGAGLSEADVIFCMQSAKQALDESSAAEDAINRIK